MPEAMNSKEKKVLLSCGFEVPVHDLVALGHWCGGTNCSPHQPGSKMPKQTIKQKTEKKKSLGFYNPSKGMPIT